MVRVWDIFVRFSHWAVALGFIVAYLSEDDVLPLHVWAGYLIGVLVMLRIVWGIIGPKHARFNDFIFMPATVIAYLRDLPMFRAKRYLGHSPAGGTMAIALWLALLGTVWSGLEVYAIEENAGPLAAIEIRQPSPEAISLLVFVNGDDHNKRDGDTDSVWEDIHEACANLTLILVLLHLVGVILASVVHRENLVRSMVSGIKRKA